ncbi:hypothetical protein AB0F96_38710 [Streptomyces sp. NPDC023998]|uniref:hypothetical protein n=1 Tax=Streptomyces sp. NPDC023998 TaxID=3154597 RepID=UPI0033E41CC2
MSTATLCFNTPWTAVSSRLTFALIAAHASESATSRPASLYDLMCNLDDAATLRAARDRAADLFTVRALDDELADLDAEHTDIRHALLRRFDGVDHDHI